MARQIMVARSNALVRTPDHGPRLKVVKNVTTAEDNAEIVRKSPHLWTPLKVDYSGPAEPQPDEIGDLAERQGLAYLEEIRRLCAALEAAGVAVERAPDDDGPVLAGNVVDAALRELGLLDGGDPAPERDETPEFDDAEPDATPEGRAAIRDWAAGAGLDVSPHGKIPADVVDQFKAAHRV